jgi:hypothetical protein
MVRGNEYKSYKKGSAESVTGLPEFLHYRLLAGISNLRGGYMPKLGRGRYSGGKSALNLQNI